MVDLLSLVLQSAYGLVYNLIVYGTIIFITGK